MLGPCQRFRAAGARLWAPPPLVVIFDALEEWKAAAKDEFMLELICETVYLVAAQLLVFPMSRPEITVRTKLGAITRSCGRRGFKRGPDAITSASPWMRPEVMCQSGCVSDGVADKLTSGLELEFPRRPRRRQGTFLCPWP